MTLTPTIYFGIWAAGMSAWLVLGQQYYEIWRSHIISLGDEIRSFNAQKGYDQSIGRNKLAKDFRTPYRRRNLKKYAENNHISYSNYVEELGSHLGNPYWHFYSVCFYLLGMIYGLSGLSYLTPQGIISPSSYLLLFFSLLFLSVFLHWFL